MMRSSLLLLACLALVMLAGDADAKEPLWSYDTTVSARSVAISADGEYIAAVAVMALRRRPESLTATL